MKFSNEELIALVEKSSTFDERINGDFVPDENSKSDTVIDYRIENWCQVAAQGNRQVFEKRLAWDGLDLTQVRRFLGCVKMSNKKALPIWASTLNDCVEQATEAVNLVDVEQEDKLAKNLFLNSQEPLPFQELLSPFIWVARQKLIKLTGYKYQIISDNAHATFERRLLALIVYLCGSTMQLEFSIFRATRQSAMARFLQDDSKNNSNRIYQDFINNLLKGGIIDFFKEYAVLGRLIGTIVNSWIDSIVEFIVRLDSDWLEIEESFQFTHKLGQVVAVEPFISDSHNNLRSVIIVTFKSGLRLVYKPRNLGVDQAYLKLLKFLNDNDTPLPFKLYRILDRATYGWVEFIKTSPCQNEDEVKKYYQRSGMLLCLVYLLEGTDLHCENIIACGEYPVIIDLETLMDSWVKEVEEHQGNRGAQKYANQLILYSVLRTGLLPMSQFNKDNKLYDFSGFGQQDQQKKYLKSPKWRYVNTDNMSLVYEYGNSKPPSNVPCINGKYVVLEGYSQEIINGFRQMYIFCLNKRNILLDSDSPFYKFNNQEVRFVFRSTQAYRFAINLSLQPKLMRNGIDRSIQLDILSRGMLLSESKSNFWSLVKLEKKSVWQLDIPRFIVNSEENSLIINSKESIKNCFTKSGFDLIISNLNKLNEDDLELQVSLIRSSLSSRTKTEIHYDLPFDRYSIKYDNIYCLNNEEKIQNAINIGIDIERKAICGDDKSVTWLAPKCYVFEKCFQLKPIDQGLYDGLGGIALFFVVLTKLTQKESFHELISNDLQSLHKNYQDYSSLNALIISGAFGLASVIYVLAYMSQLIEEDLLIKNAETLVTLIKCDLTTKNKEVDIISGFAGTILGLLALSKFSLSSESLERAVTCGNHLLDNRVVSESGYRTWATLNGQLLTGFSHGAAGIAYALLRLYKATGETRFKEAAEEAIAYERSVFIPELNNWPDFRQPQTKDNPKCMCSWCHGAPGIGLARVATLDILDTPEIRQDIEAAITTTLNYGLSDIDHLCCGNMGRVEFLFTAGRKLNRPELVDAAMKLASQVVARAEQKGHYGYGPILDFHPGFFQGASGIGYQLLRLAYPDQLPSVLLWE